MQVGAAEFLSQGRTARVVDVGQHYFRAFTGKHARCRRAYAGRRAGDDANLAVEQCHRSLGSCLLAEYPIPWRHFQER